MYSRLWAGHWGIMVPFPVGESFSLYCKHENRSGPPPPQPHIEWVMCTFPKGKTDRVWSWPLTHPSNAMARMTGTVLPLPHINWWLAQGQLYLLYLKVAKYWLLMNLKFVEHLHCWLNALIFLSSDHLTYRVFVQGKLYIFRMFSCAVIFTVAKKEVRCLFNTVKCTCHEGTYFLLVRRASSHNWQGFGGFTGLCWYTLRGTGFV